MTNAPLAAQLFGDKFRLSGPGVFESFPGEAASIGEKLPRILIVTGELIGPFKNGGIGTSMTGLAERMAVAGFPVTVLYTGAVWHVDIDTAPWVTRYAALGIELVPLSATEMDMLGGPMAQLGFGTAYLVYRFLETRPFDVVHFNDMLGEGFYALAAKRLGIAFQETLMLVALHSPSRWTLELNRMLPDNILYAAFDYAEQVSVRAADVLWGPSRYLIEWIKARGFVLPERVVLQQYVMPSAKFLRTESAASASGAPEAAKENVKPREVVFFGRLEERKGLRLFCRALAKIGPQLRDAGVSVTFLGKSVSMNGRPSAQWIKARAADWQFDWRIESGLGQPEAIAYLCSRPCVAVMPSPFDNSPCTIYEALAFRFPFIASATGGIPELIHPDDRDKVLFDYTVEALSGLLERAVRDGVALPRPAVMPEDNLARWVGFHRSWQQWLKPSPPRVAGTGKVAAVLEYRGDRPALEIALEGCARLLGKRYAGAILIARAAVPLGKERVTAIELDQDDDPGRTLLEKLEAIEAEWLLCGIAGAHIAETAPLALAALDSEMIGDGFIAAAVGGSSKRPTTIPPLGGAAAFGFYEGFSFTGGGIVRRQAAIAALKSAMPLRSDFLGILDLVIGGGA